jgi:transposase-like protein
MQTIMICPKCKSTSIRRDVMDLAGQVKILPTYVCNNCNHSGNVFPEVDIEQNIKKIRAR